MRLARVRGARCKMPGTGTGTGAGHNRTIKDSARVSDWHPALCTTPDNERMRQQIVEFNHGAKRARVDLFVV